MAAETVGWVFLVAMFLGFLTALIALGFGIFAWVQVHRERRPLVRHCVGGADSSVLVHELLRAESRDTERAYRKAERIAASEVPRCTSCGHLSSGHSEIGHCAYRGCGCVDFEEDE
ncbi:hypothetical protein [Gordonia sp. N1V]|uniref:hypothetical protein n=1 Tax=Gordonia sp. N1V TaxID=3034163 RepID=UPI0023E1284D|nr:hypothetical protein [Gordonia sp. N1V]MDF3280869.1 hypothetical protein [Gordonia sp. N1V]